MTIEVVGRDPDALKEISCRGCGARLRYGTKDIKEGLRTYYDGSSDAVYWVDCPECGTQVKLKR